MYKLYKMYKLRKLQIKISAYVILIFNYLIFRLFYCNYTAYFPPHATFPLLPPSILL